MKKISLVLLLILFISGAAFTQNVDDALRYSQIFYGGTARFMSMGGAFTAIGGDISSLSQNPAGLGIFRASELTITPQLFNARTKASFNGTNSDYLYKFNLNQAGLVSNLVSNESGLRSLNVGYSFNRTNNFNQTLRIQGLNENSSMADYWAQRGEGTNYKNLKDAEGIAYDAWIIDTITGSNAARYATVYSNYGDNPPSVYGQNMRRLISNEGYTGEHALSIGGNYENKIFFGATIGINTIRYTSHYEHMESTNSVLPSDFLNFTYTDHYEHTGTGYAIKAGVIIKPVEALRIGLAFHSPTWYKINEYFYNDISSNFSGGGKYEFSIKPQRFEFALATPFRALAGVAIQIKKIGLLSADYEYVDYASARFSETGDGYNYSVKNNEIKNALRPANNFRFGGELRLSQFYMRGGYGLYGKTFQKGEDNENLSYRTISCGLGFREKMVSFDLGFTNMAYNQKYILYPLSDNFNPAVAHLSSGNNMFTMTLGYKFGY